MNVFRIIDANINRTAEGIRVLEDISRFILEDEALTERLRTLRHKVRKTYSDEQIIISRNAESDIGYEISASSILDKKEDMKSLIASNFKRIQEGLRSIEECLKISGSYKEAKCYEAMRYDAYSLEKSFKIAKFDLNTDIYAITGEEFSKGRTNIEVVEELIKADIKVIQYREKDKTKLQKYNECIKIREMTKAAGIMFIVNDDVDIAVSVKADGIHLGQNDMPMKEAREIAGNMIIGISTHRKEQALEAVEAGADYIGVGPIFDTATKKDVEKSEGLEYLKWISENIKIPYVAIGGINEGNISRAKEHGGKCFAMISNIVGSESIIEKVNSIRQILSNLYKLH